jgi:hypothetical protein
MDEIESIPTRVKNFVARHKTGFAVAATSIAWFGLVRANLKQYNEFLTEKGLYDEFWNSED